MNEIKKTVLHYQDKRSDKIYEVMLCQIEEDKYVVNFSYGRRNSTMKEGSKTIIPVSLEKAEKMFDSLVTSKTKKGYRIVDEGTVSKEKSDNYESSSPMDFDDLSRLKRLATTPKDRVIDRVIWRLAEKGEGAAKDDILHLLGSYDSLRDYVVCRALGRCAEKGDRECLRALSKIFKSNKADDKCRRAALEASLMLADEAEKLLIVEYIKSKIPIKHDGLFRKNSAEAHLELIELIKDSNGSEGESLYYFYLLDYVENKGVMADLLPKIPLKPGYFRRIRHIFKAAEYFNDTDTYGFLSYRIEVNKADYDSRSYYVYAKVNGKWKYFSPDDKVKELKKSNSLLAYGSGTRDYLRRRVWRNLSSLALKSDINYIKCAISYLKNFKDSDCGRVDSTYSYDYSLSSWKKIYFDKYSFSFIFNRILYENSNRYDMHGMRMRCINGYKPGEPAPAEREEAYPALWDENCKELFPLLKESRCEQVHKFAIKVLKDNRDKVKFTKDEIFCLMSAPYVDTANYGLELFKSSYSEHVFSEQETVLLFNSQSLEVREYICNYLKENSGLAAGSLELLYRGAISVYSDLQSFTKEFMLQNDVGEKLKAELFTRLTALMMEPDNLSKVQIEGIGAIIAETMQSIYRKVSVEVVCDFIGSPEESLQLLGAAMALEHDRFKVNCPSEIISSLLDSSFSRVQGMGVTLFARKSDSELFGEKEMLLKFVVNSASEVRESVAPIIKRLAYADEAFANEFIPLLIFKLRKSSDEEVQRFIVRLLKEELAGIKELSLKIIMKLIRSKSTLVQELGGHFLSNSKHKQELGLDELSDLYSCDTLAVRELGWSESEGNLALLKAEVGKTVRLLDAEWEDSRQFAFNLIRENFSEKDFTPAALVSICDSVREDVSCFGRETIARYFHGEHSIDYLLKLSEHPSVKMQVFVTDYLAEYAGGDVERVRRMVPYFQGVLCRINRASRAKKSVVNFLERESLASAEAAALIAPVLTFVSATASLLDKAAYLELMVKIKRQHPQIELPVEMQEIEVNNAI